MYIFSIVGNSIVKNCINIIFAWLYTSVLILYSKYVISADKNGHLSSLNINLFKADILKT